MRQKMKLPLTLLSILLIAGVVASAWKMSVTSMALQANSIELKCDISCHESKIRTPQAELSFKAGQDQLSQIAVEVTVFKNGFAKGTLARLTGISRDGKFVIVRTDNQANVSGLERLLVGGIEVSEATGLVTVVIEGLEPGLKYYWRLKSLDLASTLSNTAVCQAPACPFDQVEEQVPRIR